MTFHHTGASPEQMGPTRTLKRTTLWPLLGAFYSTQTGLSVTVEHKEMGQWMIPPALYVGSPRALDRRLEGGKEVSLYFNLSLSTMPAVGLDPLGTGNPERSGR